MVYRYITTNKFKMRYIVSNLMIIFISSIIMQKQGLNLLIIFDKKCNIDFVASFL